MKALLVGQKKNNYKHKNKYLVSIFIPKEIIIEQTITHTLTQPLVAAIVAAAAAAAELAIPIRFMFSSIIATLRRALSASST